MAKKSKLSTPSWITGGYDSKTDWEKVQGVSTVKKKEKTFKIRKCPKCDSDNVNVIVGREVTGEWECKKCGWKGIEIKEEELSEEEFMKYLDARGEDVS